VEPNNPLDGVINICVVAGKKSYDYLRALQIHHIEAHNNPEVWSTIANSIRSVWYKNCGHPVRLIETFLNKRIGGTSNWTAYWIAAGRTKEQSRNDCHYRVQVPTHKIFLYPLSKKFPQELTCE